jgi:hypothetical protein
MNLYKSVGNAGTVSNHFCFHTIGDISNAVGHAKARPYSAYTLIKT